MHNGSVMQVKAPMSLRWSRNRTAQWHLPELLQVNHLRPPEEKKNTTSYLLLIIEVYPFYMMTREYSLLLLPQQMRHLEYFFTKQGLY